MGRQWQPIEDLPEDWKSLVDDQAHAVVQLWTDQASKLRSRKEYTDFLIKLRRQWAIETGVLERLYTLSDGATRTLIEQGLDAALLSHADSDRPLGEVIALIRDQNAVIEGLYQFVGGARALSKSYIKELHQALTAHQQYYDVIDTQRNQGRRAMVRGTWKVMPNNVRLEDGSTFEFCPAEHVEAEMDRLVTLHEAHVAEGVSADVASAWLHHRFTLIHPFVDGNGRVARALGTLVLLKADWFPLVVTRDDKVDYLKTLRQADAGELKPFVGFLGDLQRRAVRQALSLSEEVQRENDAYKAIFASVAGRIERRKKDRLVEYARAVTMAAALSEMTHQRMQEIAADARGVIVQESRDHKAIVKRGVQGTPGASFNRWQIHRTAKELGYYANLQTYPSWVELQLETKAWVGILVAFHGVGHDWLGLLGAVAMAYRKEPSEDGKLEVVELQPLCTAPFEIAYSDDLYAIEQRYRRWLEDCLILGLNFWQQHV